MANISNFLSSFNNTELARTTNFKVNIPVPGLLNGIMNTEKLSLRCESAQLPTRTFGLVEQKTYGPIKFFPIQSSYENVSLTFICSDDMKEKKFFDSWMNMISVSTPSLATDSKYLGGVIAAGRLKFDFEYKENYQTEIIISQQNLNAQDSYSIKLIEAFPISVNQLDLNWGSLNSIQKLTVVFSYRYFEIVPTSLADVLI